MRKKIAVLLLAGLLFAVGCGGDEFNSEGAINVVSREEGSGTRGAFIEITGVQVSTGGTVTDMTDPEAIIANSTSIVMTTVAENPQAIGYITTGSINDTIRPLSVDGVAPTVANIQSGAYTIARPFFVVTTDDIDEATADFYSFIMSYEGQAVVSRRYVPSVTGAPPFAGGNVSGRVVVSGSTSVAPVMESLREAYHDINPDVEVEIHITGSTAGVTNTVDGVSTMGMVSRHLREAEAEVLNYTAIAIDGIAIIVNNLNPISNLTADQVLQIFTGELTSWDEVR